MTGQLCFQGHPGSFTALIVTCAVAVAFIMLTGSGTVQAADDSSCERGPVTIDGTTTGTDCDDVIVAEPGVTEIDAGAGSDTIYATHAVEVVNGGEGNDTIFGEIPAELETGATKEAESALPGATYSGDGGDDLIYATDWVLQSTAVQAMTPFTAIYPNR